VKPDDIMQVPSAPRPAGPPAETGPLWTDPDPAETSPPWTDPDPAETSPPWTDPDPAETSPPGQTQVQQRPVHRGQTQIQLHLQPWTCSRSWRAGRHGRTRTEGQTIRPCCSKMRFSKRTLVLRDTTTLVHRGRQNQHKIKVP